MLNKRGGVEADLTVSRLEPGAANLPLAPQSDGQQRFYLHRSWPPEGAEVLGFQHIVTKAEMLSLVFQI